MKICDELLVPIVEVEYEVTSADLEGTGFALQAPDGSLVTEGSTTDPAIFPLSELGVYNPETYEILEGVIKSPDYVDYTSQDIDSATDAGTGDPTAPQAELSGGVEGPEPVEILVSYDKPSDGQVNLEYLASLQYDCDVYIQKFRTWFALVKICALQGFAGIADDEDWKQYDYDWLGEDHSLAQKFGYPTNISNPTDVTALQYTNRVKEVLIRLQDPNSGYNTQLGINKFHPDAVLVPDAATPGIQSEIYTYRPGLNLNSEVIMYILSGPRVAVGGIGPLDPQWPCQIHHLQWENDSDVYTYAAMMGKLLQGNSVSFGLGDYAKYARGGSVGTGDATFSASDLPLRKYLEKFMDPEIKAAYSNLLTVDPPLAPPEPPLWAGPYIPELEGTKSATYEQINELLSADGAQAMNHLTKNFHQFFYKRLAQTMVGRLQATPEFKLMYEHLFPMRSYMAMSFAFAGDSLSKYIPEPTDILDITKGNLLHIMAGLESSLDYTFLPDPLADFLKREIESGQTDTRAQRPDLGKLILMIIIRTSLLILKGFVEVTDPAIIIAKAIIDIANAIQQAVIASIEQGIRIAEQVATAARDIASTTMRSIEANIGIAVISPKMILEMSLSVPITDEGLAGPKLSDSVTIDTEVEGLENWIFEMGDFPPEAEMYLGESGADLEDLKETWAELQELMLDLQTMQQEYGAALAQYNEAEQQVAEVIGALKKDLAEAKKVLKDIFKSPYLLPGMWAAMLPSMLPLGGGLMPPPFPGGPPSTIPGMIYLALLFFDDWEEAQHTNAQEQNGETSCEDEL